MKEYNYAKIQRMIKRLNKKIKKFKNLEKTELEKEELLSKQIVTK